MAAMSGTIGKKGTLTLPKKLREDFGLREGTLVIVEKRDGIGIGQNASFAARERTPGRIGSRGDSDMRTKWHLEEPIARGRTSSL